MTSLSDDIKIQTKREIRESRIFTREQDKNAIAKEMKTQMNQQADHQSFSSLVQLQGLKILQKMTEDSNESESKIQQEKKYDEKFEKLEKKLDETFHSVDAKLEKLLELFNNKNDD